MVHTAGPRDSSTIPVLRLVALPRSVPIPRPAPRATLLNQAATVGGVEITLLSFVVVEHCLRLYGALRVMADHDPILATVPALELTRAGGGIRSTRSVPASCPSHGPCGSPGCSNSHTASPGP